MKGVDDPMHINLEYASSRFREIVAPVLMGARAHGGIENCAVYMADHVGDRHLFTELHPNDERLRVDKGGTSSVD